MSYHELFTTHYPLITRGDSGQYRARCMSMHCSWLGVVRYAREDAQKDVEAHREEVALSEAQ
jgi:hypothetical protein